MSVLAGTQQARWRRTGALAASLAMALAACSGGGSDGRAAPDDDADTTTTTAPPCRQDLLPADAEVVLSGGDPVAVAGSVAAGTHRCSDAVVLAPSGDAWAAAAAVAVAVGRDAPLLLVDPTAPAAVHGELARLDPDEVLAVGVDATAAPTGADPTEGGPDATGAGSGATGGVPGAAQGDPGGSDDGRWGERTTTIAAAPPGTPAPDGGVPAEAALALAVADHLGAERLVAVPAEDAEARAALASRLAPGEALLPLPADDAQLAAVADELDPATPVEVHASDPAVATARQAALAAAGVAATAIPDPVWPEPRGGTAWLVDPAQGPVAAVVAAAAAGRGEPVLPVTASDLRSGRQRTVRVRAAHPERAVLVGDVTDDASWQLPLITAGPMVPGGGFRLFEDQRMVALYGHPEGAALGVLGEQDLDAAVERARQVAAPYGADGAQVLPTFEIIATVASAEPEPLGDYSRRTPVEVLRPYVERAAAEGFYVVIDLQPGRTDFLTQAREYRELLLEPHVGLALDPEWRLLPDQRHLRQVGSVAAAEVQLVVDWLAELTRSNQLPEKLLVLHQFRLSMLPDRDTLIDPPELAMVIHMDGQGPIPSKDGTYRAITAGAEDRWLWGWKNFYDEDQPTPTPDHILGLDPTPVFVSYQ